MKTTASGRFNDPEDGSTYNPATDSWSRPYLPGEYEAEAQDRVSAVKYDYEQRAADEAQKRRDKEYEFRHRKEMEAEENASLLRRVELDNASTLRNKEYTFRQKADWENLEQAYQDAVKSGRYTKEELEVLRKQVDLQKANIKGNPFEALEPKQTAQQDIDSRLVMVNGQQMYRNSKGDLELVPTAQQNDDGFGDFVKMYPKMTKTVMQEQMDANGRMVNVPVQVQMTPEEAVAAWHKMKATWGASPAQADAQQANAETNAPSATTPEEKWANRKR